MTRPSKKTSFRCQKTPSPIPYILRGSVFQDWPPIEVDRIMILECLSITNGSLARTSDQIRGEFVREHYQQFDVRFRAGLGEHMLAAVELAGSPCGAFDRKTTDRERHRRDREVGPAQSAVSTGRAPKIAVMGNARAAGHWR